MNVEQALAVIIDALNDFIGHQQLVVCQNNRIEIHSCPVERARLILQAVTTVKNIVKPEPEIQEDK